MSSRAWLIGALVAWAGGVFAGDSAVVFSEVNYSAAGAESQWIELHCVSSVDVDLSGFSIEGAGVTYRFPLGARIGGRGYVVVAQFPGAANLSGAQALGPWSGTLGTSGTLRLRNRNGRLLDELDYRSDGEWPVAASAPGATLARRSAGRAGGGALEWTWSSGGTPGRRNFSTTGEILTVTEIAGWESSWRYRDAAAAPPANWMEPAFDDSSWTEGNSVFLTPGTVLAGSSDGLIAYWPVTETTGSVTRNAVAGSQDGTLFGGATFATSGTRGGPVLRFPGDGSYVDAGASTLPLLTADNSVTWAFWASSEQSSGVGIVVGNRLNLGGGEPSPLEFVKFTPSSLEYYRGGQQEGIDYPNFPGNSEWVHHALVKNGTSLTYYRNGVASGTSTISGGHAARQPLFFGGDRGNESWRGRLDDIAIWNRALTTDQIARLANGQSTPMNLSGFQTGTELGAGGTTFYFRRAFEFQGQPANTSLVLRLLVDDGAVVHLNGRRIHSQNMPEGTLMHGTSALSEVGQPAASGEIEIPADALVCGENVLAVEVHQHVPSGGTDMAFAASLVAVERIPPPPDESPTLVFNEISPAGAGFRFELANLGSAAIDLGGYFVRSSSGAVLPLPDQELAAGGFLVIDASALGFVPAGNERLFLVSSSGVLLDGRVVTNRLRGRGPDGAWIFPTSPTFGDANVFAIPSAIVINEIMYKQRPVSQKPLVESDEEWIELHNRSDAAVDLSGWKFSQGVGFTFPAGTMMAPGDYLVVAKNAVALKQKWPAVAARILGNFSGSLSGKGERVTLEDAAGNPVDSVEYSDGGRWPGEADGGGSSLELRDPDADNAAPEAWAASDESGRGVWQTFSWSGQAQNANNDPTRWNEFVLGLLDGGTCLIDDIQVRQNGGANLVQNGTFDSGDASTWRMLGTHRHAAVIPDPAGGGNVLRVAASGATEHMHNHAETTLKNGGSYHTISGSATYSISFRARWVSGSNQLNARLYFNRLARTVTLPIGEGGGTPGAPNSRLATNIGPTYSRLTHSPAVPAAGESAEVRIAVADPDGVGSVSLHYSVNEGAWQSVPMTVSDGFYRAEIPGQAAGRKVQFYVKMVDDLGAESMAPARGADSRAMIPWNDGQALLETNGVSPTNIRIVMPDSDAALLHTPTNVMSNDRMEATVIADERDVYYGCGVRLKGSQRGRDQVHRVGFSVRFPSDNKLFSVHKTVSMDRMSIGSNSANLEILVKRGILGAGGIPGSEDDLCRVIAPQSRHTSTAVLTKSRYDGDYLDGQYESGADGMAFKYEYVYFPTTTTGSSGSSGNVEDLKYPEPDDVRGVGVGSLGTDKERYRWYWLVENGEEKDDYDGLIGFLGAFGQNPSWPANAAWFEQIETLMDVEEWLRAFAILSLFGVGDNYGTGTGHNAIFYERPEDGRFLLFPHDMDYVFSLSATGDIAPSSDLRKLLRKPANRRAYYHALVEMCQTTFKSAWLLPWAQHYGKFSGTNMATYMSYVEQRRAHVLNQISAEAPDVAFAITTPDGTIVEGVSAILEGTGGIDIHELRLDGNALSVEWTDLGTWRATVPVQPGANVLAIQACDATGGLVGEDSVSVTSSAAIVPAVAGKLVVSELMYHPGDPTPAEKAAGFTDAEAFEFVELANISDQTLDLTGIRFTAGITFTFPAGTLVPAGGRIVLAHDRAAFEARYGSGIPLVEGQYGPGSRFDNAGELVALVDAAGLDIVRFTYSDDPPWSVAADGDGYSLALVRPGTNPHPGDASSWRMSTTRGGNPGASDATVFSGDPHADDDGNGISNLLQYASAGSSAYAHPSLTIAADGQWTLRFQRNLAAEDVEIRAESSADFATWTELAGDATEQPRGDGTVIVTRTGTATSEAGFFRIRAVSLQ